MNDGGYCPRCKAATYGAHECPKPEAPTASSHRPGESVSATSYRREPEAPTGWLRMAEDVAERMSQYEPEPPPAEAPRELVELKAKHSKT